MTIVNALNVMMSWNISVPSLMDASLSSARLDGSGIVTAASHVMKAVMGVILLRIQLALPAN